MVFRQTRSLFAIALFALTIGITLLIGRRPSLGDKFERAGFHPRLNNERVLMTRATDGAPIDKEYEYAFDQVPQDQIQSFLEKNGYKVVYQDKGLLGQTRMIHPNAVFKWRVDEVLSFMGTPVDEHFPKQTTLLTTSHALYAIR